MSEKQLKWDQWFDHKTGCCADFDVTAPLGSNIHMITLQKTKRKNNEIEREGSLNDLANRAVPIFPWQAKVWCQTDVKDHGSWMEKPNTTSSLRHLNAALASTACFLAKLLLVLTRCRILVVPGLEHPHQQKQIHQLCKYMQINYACSIVQVSQIPTRIEQEPPKKNKHSSIQIYSMGLDGNCSHFPPN